MGTVNYGPVAVSYFTGNVINRRCPLVVQCYLGRLQTSMWISNVDRPRHIPMQSFITYIGLWRTIARLLIRVARLLIAWVWFLPRRYCNFMVSYIDNNIRNTIWSCRPSLWNVLTRYKLITIWNLQINSNMLGRLTIQIRMANFNIIIVGISINNLTCLRIRIINKFVTITAANKRITDYHIIGDFLRLSSFKPIN